MCDSCHFPKWQADTIEQLLELDYVNLSLLILNKNSKMNNNIWSKVIQNLKKFKIRYFFWYVFKFLSELKSKSSVIVDLSWLQSESEIYECETNLKGKFSNYFKDEDIKYINDKSLDFILRFSFGIIRGEILKSAKYGIWSFHHGDEQKFRGGPAGFWEIYNGENVTGSILQVLNNKLDSGTVLFKGFFKTKNSYTKNFDNIRIQSTNWPKNLAIQIRNNELEIFKNNPTETSAKIFITPTNFQILNYFKITFISRIKLFFNRLFVIDNWNIGILDIDLNEIIRKKISNFDNIKINWLNEEETRFKADPFSVTFKNKKAILYESLKFGENKGEIYINYDNKQHKILSSNNHFSFPFTFEFEEQIYVVPETAETNDVKLYKFSNFPSDLTHVSTLIKNYAGIDNVIFYYEKIWYMFSTEKNNFHKNNLNIFYSDSLYGDWFPHPKNPVKKDIRSARSAGAIINIDQNLYRPSMDYSKKIEGRIIISKIDKLSKTDFSESFYMHINPIKNSLYPDKIHTIGKIENQTIIDACREEIIFSSIFFLKYQLKNIYLKLKS